MVNWKRWAGWAAAFVCVCHWCLLAAETDGYTLPYVLTALLGAWAAARRDRRHVPLPRERRMAAGFGGLLAAATVLANYSYFLREVSGIVEKLILAIEVPVTFAGGFLLFREIFLALGDFVQKQPEKKPYSSDKRDKWVLLGAWGCLAGIYLVMFYAFLYPGVLTPDSMSQILQALYGQYSNHHPVVHTLLIRLCLALGSRVFGNMNAGVALYSVCSAIVLSLCFAYAICTAYQATRRKSIAILSLLFYALVPVHIIYSVTMWKDVPFAIVVLSFVISSYRLACRLGRSHGCDLAVFLLSGAGMCLLRSNGLLAFAISVLMFMLLLGKKEKKLSLLLLLVLCGSFVVKHPVLKAMGVTQPDTVEALSIPLQQISRVVADGKPLTQEEQVLLNHVVDIEQIHENYVPWLSDPMKDLVRTTGDQTYITQNKGAFLKLYLQLGMRNPRCYFAAWVDQTKGYWNGGYDYWRWTMRLESNNFGIFRTVHMPRLYRVVSAYFYHFGRLPVLQLLLSIGLCTWTMLAALYAAWLKKDRAAVFAVMPPLFVVMTLLVATPVYAEFRYFYSVYCCLPFLLSVCIAGGKRE